MKIEKTDIEGCFLITPSVFGDERGYFFESYNKNKFEELTGIQTNFVQDNQSFSTKGVLRGLHFQKGAFAQAKLVRVLRGEVMDVVVDIRPKSSSFKKVFTVPLSEDNKTQLFIPRGCAHGFVTLSKEAIFAYKCDNFYNKDAEAGLLYNDTSFTIDWQFAESQLIISEKDRNLPTFEEYTQGISELEL